MTRIRTVDEFLDPKHGFNPTPAERALIEACRAGEKCRLGDGTRPKEDSEARRVRAELIRLLILGGTEACGLDGSEVWLEGAWVTGVLDLRSMQSRGRLVLGRCHFTHRPDLHLANLNYLSLQGSHLPGLFAEGLRVQYSMHLDKSTSTDTVFLTGARIGGELNCSNSNFKFEKNSETTDHDKSFCAQHIKVSQSFSLKNSSLTGTLDLANAEIFGNLNLKNIKFYREKTFTKNGNKYDFFAENLKVTNALIFTTKKPIMGAFYLVSAQIGDLIDNPGSWDQINGEIDLEGLVYQRIFFDAKPENHQKRLEWLQKGSRADNKIFSPQPYTQLAKVYASMGHNRLARRVLTEREFILGCERRLADYKRPDKRYLFPLENPWADAKYIWRWVTDRLALWVVGYGHEPWRALIWLALLWLTATGLSHQAWKQGDFAPNSDVMLVSDGWQAKLGEANPAEAWSNKGEAGQDWESFNRYAWGLDLVVPILDIGQTAAWQPSKDRGPAGYRLWWARWVLEAMGWLVSALGVAAITGIMQKDRD